jgi:hypothetical protein
MENLYKKKNSEAGKVFTQEFCQWENVTLFVWDFKKFNLLHGKTSYVGTSYLEHTVYIYIYCVHQ